MKSRFTTIDVSAAVNDLKILEGARIINVYDINHKTYIMKLSSAKEKFLLLFESGIRIHRAYHDYQKSSFPSNFSVKLRKHLNNRRLVSQLGMDRIVDMQVDEGERCFHVIVELYDRGNIVLTDSSYTILNILRPRSEKDTDVRLVVKERGPYKKFESFSEAVDAFCAAQDAQKQQQTALRVEKEAMKKLENVKKDQFRRIMELEDSRDMNMKMADLIIFNQDLVDSAVAIISRAIAQKASWGQIKEMHRKAAENGDQVARIKFVSHNRVIIVLMFACKRRSRWDVPIDVGMTAFSNSRELYQCMKAATEKVCKNFLLNSANKAIKNSEAKTHNAIKEVHSRVDTARVRKKMWFEEFIWFISSENYMVIVGRDADQNELLVKRYLRPGDIYVHADAHGAASVVIRNKKGGGPIPPKTMTEAAQMAVCSSSSWSSHIVSNAWWVYDYQVSKVAPSGEYLVHGSFMIRGKKNFMPRSPLQLGFGILFRVDEVSVTNRRQKTLKAKNIRKHKMDKIRRKYRDQDDEEREMRLAAIGARGIIDSCCKFAELLLFL
uniref:NFACT-R_1 domain-containing protein n=1 Tax=Angiostrongylus cantonensis TaxID=6313 RepID=A0A0K0DK33_ANGCA